jgi:hypothetical protein
LHTNVYICTCVLVYVYIFISCIYICICINIFECICITHTYIININIDGSEKNHSMTYAYEKELNWQRILIEGDPVYRDAMLINSPLAFSVNAAMCIESAIVHYSSKVGTGGIIEYMSSDFLNMFHSNLYNTCIPPGNLTSLDYSTVSHLVKEVDCMPLSNVLNAAHVKHVNYFILDVEGAELTVLKSIDWKLIQFDVLCIETEPHLRPKGYKNKVTSFLLKRGYILAADQQGRNTW